MEELSSKYLNRAVSELSKLPGIGKKTALRLALYLMRQQEETVDALGNSLIDMRHGMKFCKRCHNISDGDLCRICRSPKRNNGHICVVEDINDVIAIEKTGEFFGLYHVLGGVISPMDGIGPSDLKIESLINRIEKENIEEVILALPTTIEGDTTNFFLYKKLAGFDIAVTTIARGVGIGDELEYIDEITLGRSIANRLPYKSGLKL
jgi:recombination protein RecR